IEKGFSPILDVWKEFSCILGENVLVYQDDTKFFGKAIDVDQSGALILKLKNGSITKIFSGDVSIRRQK
ncbi:MAG: bifunctional biotin--[acetyl-CoA-carboxylase] synthetase/biotin operon repressor, partial [Candidatus Lokiarchaeota archaeon]|nr:bifunctional biotin--[acetyl-CoA-carboxylase] synthetase/biotin operon repressor [Candidatus Lokiarchaeota archaeon]